MNQMTLSEERKVPADYVETVQAAIRQTYAHYKWIVEQQFGFYDLPHVVEPLKMMLADPLALIARAAAGELAHGQEIEGELAECIQTVMETLYATPLHSTYHIPAEFWDTDLGAMIARGNLWLRGDELITIVETARRFGISQQAVTQALDAGRLRPYHDPDAPQRQGARLVSDTEAKQLWGGK